MTTNSSKSIDVAALAAGIVSSFVANNSLPATELPALFSSVHTGLARIANGPIAEAQLGSGGACPCCAGAQVDHPGSADLPGRRARLQIVEAAFGATGNDAGSISRQVEPAGGLPDGCAQLCGVAVGVGQELRVRSETREGDVKSTSSKAMWRRSRPCGRHRGGPKARRQELLAKSAWSKNSCADRIGEADAALAPRRRREGSRLNCRLETLVSGG